MQKSIENQSVSSNFSGMDYYSRKVTRRNRIDASLTALIASAKQKLSSNDVEKLSKLKCMDIPQEDGSIAHFAVLEKTKHGCIEEIYLMHIDSLKKQLKTLIAGKNPDDFQLKPQAVLKLPKHESILEIHHEALALGLARVLGLHSIRYCFVSYLGRPALFLPIEGIKLFNELDLEIHGEGLQPDSYVEDFGHALAFLYLCNEADNHSGQILGLANAKELNIYNPVLNPTPKLVHFSDIDDGLNLDASLSVHPANNDPEIDQHFHQIDDSSMHSKFQSLWNAYKSSKTIISAFDNLAAEIQIREVQLNELPPSFFNSTIISELNDLTILKDDLAVIVSSIKSRLVNIERLFTSNNFSGNLHAHNIKQVLILEKLLQLPVLFSFNGHPYRHPWINKPTNIIKSMVNTNDSIVTTFEHHINPLVCERLKTLGLKSMEWSGNTIKISRRDLNAVTETMLYPEADTILQAKINYSSKEDLLLLFQAYGEKAPDSILVLFEYYDKQMKNTKASIADKLRTLESINHELNAFLKQANNKGLYKHILRKFHFSMQVQLQKMISQPLLALINSAFSAAVKLDRLIEFNKVLVFAISNNHLQDAPFKDFLNFCIKQEQNCSSFVQAQTQSKALFEYAEHKTVPFLQSANDTEITAAKADLKINTIL